MSFEEEVGFTHNSKLRTQNLVLAMKTIQQFFTELHALEVRKFQRGITPNTLEPPQ
jgi:hypothetical protein